MGLDMGCPGLFTDPELSDHGHVFLCQLCAVLCDPAHLSGDGMNDNWLNIEIAPMDGRRLLLTVEVKGQRHVVIGGYDGSWSGNMWVFENVRVPVGTEPKAWMPMPSPYSRGDK